MVFTLLELRERRKILTGCQSMVNIMMNDLEISRNNTRSTRCASGKDKIAMGVLENSR